MIRHPYDYEAPPLSTEGERAQFRHDVMRNRPIARTYFVPPLAAYDIHASLMAAIREWDEYSQRGNVGAETYVLGLREAYFIVFGESAP